MSGPMFDLEGCDDAILKDNKTTSNQFIKARNCPRIHLEGNQAGMNALSEMGIPIDALTEEQVNFIISTILNNKGEFEITDSTWLSDTAMFATLASSVKATIIGAVLASGKLGFNKIKEAIKHD